jgi:DNA-binding LacI/PurR family transcriptional regulator
VNGFEATAGVEGARRLMAVENPPTAIFAFSDLPAVGAMCAVQQAGLRLPQDFAIVGFNDIPLASLLIPPLTTVVAPAYEMGMEAIKMLQCLISGKRPSRNHILLPTNLVIRQSCGQHDDLHPC